MNTLFELKKHYFLESARYLPQLPQAHPCHHIHGHSFKVTICVRGSLDKNHWVIDYKSLDDHFALVKNLLDHKLLNEVPGLEFPTTEVLTRFIFEKLRASLGEALYYIEISETPDTSCRYPV